MPIRYRFVYKWRRSVVASSLQLHDLQFVCDRLATWAEKWQLRIAFDTCSVHRISNRNNVNTTDCSPKYKLGEHVLRWPDGVIIMGAARIFCRGGQK